MNDELKRTLMQARDHLARHYPIQSLGVFGSVARNEERDNSDIDILIEFSGPIGWEIADIRQYLEQVTHRKVDLVTPGAVRPLLRQSVYRDLREV